MGNPVIITIMGWIVCISAGYFLFSVIIPYFIVPNLHIIKLGIQKTKKLRNFSLKFRAKNKKKTLKNIFDYVIQNFSGQEEKYKVIILPYKIMYYDVEKIIGKKQFLHCTIQNRIIMTLLINTGQFSEKDFIKKLGFSDFGTIHQYLVVKLNGKKFKIDTFYRIFKEIK